MLKWLALFTGIFVCCTQTTFAAEAKSVSTNKTIVVLETNVGNIELDLRPDIAPKTCENFIGLVNNPTGTGRGGESIWGGKFKDEFSKDVSFNHSGILAMANAGPNTNGSQFFITTAPTPWLNNKHTIFGEVADSSKEVLKKIEMTKTDLQDRPVSEIKIVKAYVKS